MHHSDVKGFAAAQRLTTRDLEALGAIGAIRRLVGTDRVTLQSVNVHFAGIHGFRRFAAYGSLSVMVDHGEHFDVTQIDFEAAGPAVADERSIDLITILDDRDLPVAH